MANKAAQRVLRPAEQRKYRSHYVASLDGLRAFAVLSVIFYHMGLNWAPGGLMGVTVFFVISGYLINGLLVAEYEPTGTISLPQFWLRRVRRIIPAVLLALAGTLVLCALVSPALFAKARSDLLPSLFFFNNWWQIFHNVSYFEASAAPSPLTHYWSLAIEEQFYIVWPLLLLLLLKLRIPKKGLAAIVAVLALASVGEMAFLYNPSTDPSRVYYGTDTRAASLLIGAFLALVWPSTIFGHRRTQSKNSGERLAFNVLGVVSLAALVVIVLTTSSYTPFPYRGGIAVVSLLTALLIAVLVVPNTWVARLLQLRPLVWIGKRSYGMYLWHYPIILATSRITSTVDVPWWVRISQLIIIFAVSELSYRFVENPIRTGALRRWWQNCKTTDANGVQKALGHLVRPNATAMTTIAICAILACGAGAALAVMPPMKSSVPQSSSTSSYVEASSGLSGSSAASPPSSEAASSVPSADAADSASPSTSTSAAVAVNPASSASAPSSNADDGKAASQGSEASVPSASAASAIAVNAQSTGVGSDESDVSGSSSQGSASSASSTASAAVSGAASAEFALPSNGTESKASNSSTAPSASAQATDSKTSAGSESGGSKGSAASGASTDTVSASSAASSTPAPSEASSASGASAEVSANSIESDKPASASAQAPSTSTSSESLSSNAPENRQGSLAAANGSPGDGTDEGGSSASASSGSAKLADDQVDQAPKTPIAERVSTRLSEHVEQLTDEQRAQAEEAQRGVAERTIDDITTAIDESVKQAEEQQRQDKYDELFNTEHMNSSGSLIFDPLLIGDSVAAGCENEFYRTFPYGHSDAEVNRNIWESPYAFYSENNQVGEYVVFCLGTNNAVIDEQIDEILNIVGPNKKVVLVNIRCPRDWEAQTNKAIADAPKRHSNVVAVVDWYSASAGHDEYFYEDGIHVNNEGAKAYISLIQQAIQDSIE